MINPAPIIYGNVPWSLQEKDFEQSQLLKKEIRFTNHVHIPSNSQCRIEFHCHEQKHNSPENQ